MVQDWKHDLGFIFQVLKWYFLKLWNFSHHSMSYCLSSKFITQVWHRSLSIGTKVSTISDIVLDCRTSLRNLYPSSAAVIQHHPAPQQAPPHPIAAPQAPPAAHQYYVRRQPNFLAAPPHPQTLPPPPSYEAVVQQQQQQQQQHQQQQQPPSRGQRLLNAVWRMHYCPPVGMNPRHQVFIQPFQPGPNVMKLFLSVIY